MITPALQDIMCRTPSQVGLLSSSDATLPSGTHNPRRGSGVSQPTCWPWRPGFSTQSTLDHLRSSHRFLHPVRFMNPHILKTRFLNPCAYNQGVSGETVPQRVRAIFLKSASMERDAVTRVSPLGWGSLTLTRSFRQRTALSVDP